MKREGAFAANRFEGAIRTKIGQPVFGPSPGRKDREKIGFNRPATDEEVGKFQGSGYGARMAARDLFPSRPEFGFRPIIPSDGGEKRRRAIVKDKGGEGAAVGLRLCPRGPSE
ncbi:hypothetical protein B4135_2860 [Caldibacillus debilis]|uniref:Uncharacterized protein n=1 Tax=Caldibacillus debilis TaxID=301148 RepID=A0A150LQ69_9BACI|nr:hypothetical protein B4135_2860 [Caldibacillus debilis]